jgi:hemoglobin
MFQDRAAAQREKKVATLYDRLGGETTVNAAVQQLYRKVLADGRIAPFFETVDMERQIAMQKAFLSWVLGGPDRYTGRDMRQSHKHLVVKGLNDSHVDAFVEHVSTTLRELGVTERDILEVAALADSVRDDVLGR